MRQGPTYEADELAISAGPALVAAGLVWGTLGAVALWVWRRVW